MTCRRGSCDTFVGLKRVVNEPKSPDEVRFCELWTEIVMPKILAGKEFRWTELSPEELKRRSHNGDHTT